VKGEVFRFLVAGGTAALVNWLARIVLSLLMPFAPSVILAYALGMLVGFYLYRGFVWRAEGQSWRRQIGPFMLVNLIGAAIVLGSALALLALGEALFGASALLEASAHGAAIAIGALVNYLGHSRVTFRPRGLRVMPRA
jgi:putative flippase GtrA